MSLYYNKSPRTTIRRRAGRGRYDRQTIEAILDEGLVGHVALVDKGQPYAIPMLYARGPNEQELAATEVVALTVREASAKARSGPPIDAGEDYQLPAWAGELPLELVAGTPVADDHCRASLPAYLTSYAQKARG